ncbi:MAG: hypothetical protein AB7O39_14110 [Flavobacteriaceae bacterium]
MPTDTGYVDAPKEAPAARKNRRAFFKGWIALSVFGFLAVLALSFIYSATGEGEALTAWVTYGLVFALAITAFVWLVSYVVAGQKRR